MNMERQEYFLDLLEGDQDDPNVQYEIGRCYLQGDGIEPDGARAEEWLRKAADQGQEDAIALLQIPQEEGMTGTITPENLLEWCAAAEDGDPEAQYQAALYFQQQGGPGARQDVKRYLGMAADQGHPMACTTLGEELLRKNPQEAVRHLKNAADCGVPRAMNLLGQCYAEGRGVAKNEAEAQRWFEGAAERGDAEDKLAMALRFRFGEGMPCSPGRAMTWLHRAQQAGMSDAMARYDQAVADRLAQEQAAEARRQEEARQAEERRQQEARAAEERRQAEERRRQEEARRREEAARRQEEELLRQAQEQRREAELQRKYEAYQRESQQRREEYHRRRDGAPEAWGQDVLNRAQNVLKNGLGDQDRQELHRQIDRGLDTAASLWAKAKQHGRRMAQRLKDEGIIADNSAITPEPPKAPAQDGTYYVYNFTPPTLTGAAKQEAQRQKELYDRLNDTTDIPFEDNLFSLAQEGSADAQWVLGACYFLGDWRFQNGFSRFERAAYWLEKSARQGNANGQYYYGCCFACGAGVEKDLEAAASWWGKAANQGHTMAIECYKRCCLDENGRVLKINVEGFPKTDDRYTKRYFPYIKDEAAAEEAGRQAALMAKLYDEREIPLDGDPEELAESGNADAQWLLGWTCMQGILGAPLWYERFEKAAHWAQKAAEQGHAGGMWLYGNCFACGAGVEKDLDQAVLWWDKAARLGVNDATEMLQKCEYDFDDHAYLTEEISFPKMDDYFTTQYLDFPPSEEEIQQKERFEAVALPFINGEVTDEDVKRLRQLADQGDSNAQWAMGYCCWNGKYGTPMDELAAAEWFGRSADQDNSMGILYYGNCLAVLNNDLEQAYDLWMDAYLRGCDMAARSLRTCKFSFEDRVIEMNPTHELVPVDKL